MINLALAVVGQPRRSLTTLLGEQLPRLLASRRHLYATPPPATISFQIG